MRAPTPLTAARWLLDGTLVVLVAVVLAALLVARLLPALGHQTVTINGRSMEPTMPLGSVVVLDRVAPDDLAPGDVVTLTVPERLITYTHRVVEIVDRSDGRWLRTKGDFNQGADPALARADWVVGRPALTLPGLGFLLQLLALPSGMLAVMGLALTLFLSARLIEELEWEIDDERRPVPPAFPTPTEAHAAAARAGQPSAPMPRPRAPADRGPVSMLAASAAGPSPDAAAATGSAGSTRRTSLPTARDAAARDRIRARTSARSSAGPRAARP